MDKRSTGRQAGTDPVRSYCPMSARLRSVSALALALVLVAATPMAATARRPAPGPSGPLTVSFAGETWTVKDHNRKIGPGPNFFSASNVTVVNEKLQLEINQAGRQWTVAEVIMQGSPGYGTYTWVIETPIALDPNVVLGLFTWHDDPAYNHREIDIEFAKWGNGSAPTNAQYVVQPYDAQGHQYRWAQASALTRTTHSFTWRPDSVEFRSTASDGSLIESWLYDGQGIPVPGGENPRINLWLFRGAAPTDGQPVRVVIESFTHSSLAGS